jgi:hypothetical protein
MTARKLHISPQLALPQDTVTSTMIVYGGKGMGKTNFGSVLAEECAAAGLRFAIIDPMGVWWGLRHSADGKGPGIEVLILGGIHGDIPIEPTGGAVVADLVVDEDANVIIDISRKPDGTMWSIADRVRFVRDYCKRLYQRQGEKRRPLLQGIDEAARFIPQIIRKDDSDVAACMGAIAVLVEEGRNVGIGVCLITQRSARLNKDVAELADCMVAFRTVGPNSRRAVLDWLGEHVDKTRIKVFDEQLRALPRGSALVVSPGWLEFEGIVPMRMRQTFDSSATPKVGQTVRASGPGAKPDLAKYQARMAATIEKAKAEDPKLLREQVARLQRELAKKGTVKIEPRAETKIERVAVPMLTEEHLAGLKAAAAAIQGAFANARGVLEQMVQERGALTDALSRIDRAIAQATKARAAFPVAAVKFWRGSTTAARDLIAASAGDADVGLGKGELAVLRAIAHYPEGCSSKQLTVLTGYKKSSRDTYLQKLAAGGLIMKDGPLSTATAAGLAVLGPDFEPLPIGAELLEHWRRRLPEGERKILEVVVEAFPRPIDRETISETTGYKKSSRDTYLQKLASRKLVELGRGGAVTASEMLFDGAA